MLSVLEVFPINIFVNIFFFFLMIRRPPRSTRVRSSAASDVYKRQLPDGDQQHHQHRGALSHHLSLIHISEPTRLLSISYAVFCLKKKKNIAQAQKKQKKKQHTNTNTKHQQKIQ